MTTVVTVGGTSSIAKAESCWFHPSTKPHLPIGVPRSALWSCALRPGTAMAMSWPVPPRLHLAQGCISILSISPPSDPPILCESVLTGRKTGHSKSLSSAHLVFDLPRPHCHNLTGGSQKRQSLSLFVFHPNPRPRHEGAIVANAD